MVCGVWVDLFEGDVVIVEGDVFLLCCVVVNLVDNVVDFLFDYVCVMFLLSCCICIVEIVVCDVGFGILEYVEVKVFEKFYLLVCLYLCKKSIGLGLFFVCEIVVLYCGCVMLVNVFEGGGVIVMFMLLGLFEG